MRPEKTEHVSINGLLRSANQILWLDSCRIALFGSGTGPLSKEDVMVTATLVPTETGFECAWSRTYALGFSLLGPVGVVGNLTLRFLFANSVMPLDSQLLLQSVEGKIFSADVSDLGTLSECPDLSFPVSCPTNIIGKSNEGEAVVGLSSSGRVYHGQHLIMESVTSMIKHVDKSQTEVLLLTTRENKLVVKKFTDLFNSLIPSVNKYKQGTVVQFEAAACRSNKVVQPQRRTGATAGMYAAMMPAHSQMQATSLLERDIEQGARLIASPPGQSPRLAVKFIFCTGGVEVIFQMPRGNLEVVSLRLFVLQEVISALKVQDFKTAWVMATMHRVDLNIMVDYNWPHFLKETCRFVSALQSPEVHCDTVRSLASVQDICDLMTALRQKSLFETGSIYCVSLPDSQAAQEDLTEEKVTTVCMALRAAMIELDEDKYCKAIVLSYARHVFLSWLFLTGRCRSDPPDLESALKCVKRARTKEIEHENNNTSEAAQEVSRAGAALKHLMLYIETAELYRVALGLYDLSLAYMVVTHAQVKTQI